MNAFPRSRLLLASAVLGLGIATLAVPADAQMMRLSSMMTEDSFEGRAYTRFAELVTEYTGGQIEVRVFPNEQLGNMETVVEQLSQGIIQIVPSSISFLSRWETGIRYASAPFLFDDYDHWARFIESDYFQAWLDSVEAQVGITVLGSIPDFPRGSYRTIVSRVPIAGIEDVAGLRVRQFQDRLVIDAWEHLGAEVRVLPWGDVYDGINRGIVDAVTSPAELIESTRFYEVAPHIARTDEYPQAVAFMMNAAAFNGLSEENRQALLRAHAEASAYARELIDTAARDLVATLTGYPGVTFDDDMPIGPFVERMAEFYQARAESGELPEGFLEAVEAAR